MTPEQLSQKYLTRNNCLYLKSNGRRVGTKRGKTHVTMVNGRWYKVSELIDIIEAYYAGKKHGFDPDKPCETISGMPARLYDTGHPGYHGAVQFGDTWYIQTWLIDGTHPDDARLSLRSVK